MRKVRHAAGFTLIEIVVAIVILAISSVAVVNLVARVGAGKAENNDLQVGAQLIQECGEWILAQHRRDQTFFDSFVSTSTCLALPSYTDATGFAWSNPDVVVASHSGGVGCPTGATCKLATITLTKGGYAMNSVRLILAKYN